MTYSLTQGVVKNIIPAIASTNAIIAASCCNEAFKIATNSNPYLRNYMMYSGDDGIYTYTFEHQQKEDCPVCGNLAKDLEVDGKWTLRELIERLGERPEAYAYPRPPLKTLPSSCKALDISGRSRNPRSGRRRPRSTTKPRRSLKRRPARTSTSVSRSSCRTERK